MLKPEDIVITVDDVSDIHPVVNGFLRRLPTVLINDPNVSFYDAWLRCVQIGGLKSNPRISVLIGRKPLYLVDDVGKNGENFLKSVFATMLTKAVSRLHFCYKAPASKKCKKIAIVQLKEYLYGEPFELILTACKRWGLAISD